MSENKSIKEYVIALASITLNIRQVLERQLYLPPFPCSPSSPLVIDELQSNTQLLNSVPQLLCPLFYTEHLLREFYRRGWKWQLSVQFALNIAKSKGAL